MSESGGWGSNAFVREHPLRRGDAVIPADQNGPGGIRLGALERRMRERWRTVCRTKPTIMPIGIIKQSTEEGASFILTRPGDDSTLKINSPVRVWNTHWDQDEIPSGVMIRGHVTEIGPTTATFKVTESKIGPYWPKDADTLAPGPFVHLALPDSFEVDRSQIATQEEEKLLDRIELAQQFKEGRKRKDSRSTTAKPPPEPSGSEQEQHHTMWE